MNGKNFTEIKKKTPKLGKHILFVLLGVFVAIVIGYFIFTGFRT